MKKGLLGFILGVLLASGADAQPLKRLYLGIDDHTDFMWTANDVAYDSAFVKMLDYYLDQIESTQHHPADFQARFNCDGSYWLQAYQKYRSPARFEKLLSRIRSGHISVPLHYLINCYGGQPAEAVIRGMYYAGQMERKYNLRFRMAGSMENNTIPLGLSSLWAGSGAKYSWYGIGGYGSQMTDEYRANRRHQLYHYTGLDSAGVIMKWYEHNKQSAPFGGYAELRMVRKYTDLVKDMNDVVSKLDAMCDTSPGSKYPFLAAAAIGFGHDDLSTFLSGPVIEVARQRTDATHQVRVAVCEDFFEDVEKHYPHLPSESVTYGNEWDLYVASMNEAINTKSFEVFIFL